VAVRGAAVMLVAMLVPFTVVVLRRALEIHGAGGLPFCAIKFDCGCGAGEVFICKKLTENALLTVLSTALIFWRSHRLCLRHALFTSVPVSKPAPDTPAPMRQATADSKLWIVVQEGRR